MGASYHVRAAGEDDWAVVREVRLAALLESPGAFGSTYADEVSYDEARWRAFVRDVRWFVAMADGRPVGVAAGAASVDRSAGELDLISMWVSPPHRGTGVAHDLVTAVAAWARDEGARVLALYVVVDGGRARAFYQRAGFTWVRDEPLRRDPSIIVSKLTAHLNPDRPS